MNEKDFDALNDLSVSMEHMTSLMELVENMVSMLACSDVTDNKEKERLHISRLWALVAGMVELQHQRENDVDRLLEKIQIIKSEALE